jgi:hypothetical protein
MTDGRSRRWLEGIFLTGMSVLALLVSAYATYWQRQQARAMVLPRLQVSTWFDAGKVTIALENVGVGPADIKTVQVSLGGKPVTSWKDFFVTIDAFKGVENPRINSATVRGRVIGPGRETKVLEIVDLRAAARVRAVLPRLTVELCYCSVLEECWHLVDGEGTRHDPARSCRGLPNTFED